MQAIEEVLAPVSFDPSGYVDADSKRDDSQEWIKIENIFQWQQAVILCDDQKLGNVQ